MHILITDPSLVVLVGAAGSGKSTFASRHFAADEVLSSDRYRAMVSGDETDQGATRAAFGRLHRDLDRRLAAGLLTVVDATNVEPSARRALLTRAAAARLPAVAIVFDLPPDVILARNAARSRTVDERVVRRHLDRVRSALDGPQPVIEREGFARIVILRDAGDVDHVAVRRRRS
jgi:protein phosphatase